MITYSNVSNPQWANSDNTAILVNVEWSTVGSVVRSKIYSNDINLHVQTLYNEIIAGVHGSIADYVPPTPEQIAQELDATLVNQANSQRDSYLRQYVIPYAQDILSWGELTTVSQESVTAYRKALLNIDKQPGYPENITWPTPPSIEFLPSDD